MWATGLRPGLVQTRPDSFFVKSLSATVQPQGDPLGLRAQRLPVACGQPSTLTGWRSGETGSASPPRVLQAGQTEARRDLGMGLGEISNVTQIMELSISKIS